MTKHTKTEKLSKYVVIGLLIPVVSIVFALLMVIPVWKALAVGLASVSIVLFSFSTLASLTVFFSNKSKVVRSTALTAVIFSLFSLIVPQIAFINAAKLSGAKLAFNPVSYMTFSGSTDIKPHVTKTYKTVGNQKLSLSYYKPEKVGNNPIVVLLHGGAWRYGSHLDTGQWPAVLTREGYAVASVEYRLSNDTYHSWEDTPADVHDAVTYLKDNAQSFNIDKDQMHLLGQSAGGHLSLLEAYRFESVKSVIALYAPIDLTLDYETSRDKSAELDFTGGPPKQFSERYESLSPITYVNQDEPRTLLIQGNYDDLVHPSQASRLSSILETNNVQNEMLLLPLTGHSFENQRGGFATQITTQRVLKFLKQ